MLKVYGVLRWDDLQRLKPRDISLRASGLVGRLSQTKTSGAGKKVRDLPLFVPGGAYVLCADWLRTGHELWSHLGSKERDYFLPRFTGDLADCFGIPASAGDLAILGRKVLGETKVPVWGADGFDGWSEGLVPLVPVPLLNGWTGHSERCTLPSLFAAMGVAKQDRDPLGRWSPSGSDDYVRTYRALVQSLMKRMRAMLGEGNVFKAADEEEAIEDVKVYAARSGNEEPEVLQEAADRLISTAKVFYGLLSMSPADAPAEAPREAVVVDTILEDKVVGPPPPYVIVLSKRGAVLRLHRSDGCYKAQHLAFASYEVCELEPVPRELYTHYCHSCWPAPHASVRSESGEDSTDSSTSTAFVRCAVSA